MNTSTILRGNSPAMVSHGSGNHGKAASEPPAEGAEQRFADVLPLAKAALKSSSEKNVAEKTRKGGCSLKAPADEAPSAGTHRPTSREEKTLLGNPQGFGWPLVDLVQPVMRQPAKGGSGVSQQAQSVAGVRTGAFSSRRAGIRDHAGPHRDKEDIEVAVIARAGVERRPETRSSRAGRAAICKRVSC